MDRNPRVHYRQDLFPPIEPYATGMLPLDAHHTMYWEQSGNPHGVPVLFLHGGPGAGATPTHRRFFDPALLPHRRLRPARRRPLAAAGLARGQHDSRISSPIIEALRRHLGIERWVVFGGSWGSTLALAYAEAHPERCRGLVLRGIFLCRQNEIDWFLYGMRTVFPEAWRAFSGFLPESRARRPARRLLPPPDRSRPGACTCRRRAPGAPTRAPARPCCRAPTRSRPSARTAWRWASPASRRIISAPR